MAEDAPPTFAERVKGIFGDRVVDKALAGQETFARLPRYVSEYLIAKYVREETLGQDLEKIKARIQDHIPNLDARELVKDRLMRDGSFVVIDAPEVRVDLRQGVHWATVPCLENRYVRIDDAIVSRHPGLLAGGMWGTVKLSYRPELDRDHPVSIVGFTPFQVDVTSVADVIAARGEFTNEEWVTLLLSSVGIDAERLETERQRLLILSRLIPLVERNVNMIELGPRQTGKTFLLRNTSPHVFCLSGGKATPANLFVNLATRSVGILGSKKVVMFDEVASTTFSDAEDTVSMMKDYMESGQFSRGTRTYSSEASIYLSGNIEVEDGLPLRRYHHLFEVLPRELIDAAFLDRIHGYIPGWEIPKITPETLARGPGFVIDYFGEYLVHLRNLEFRGEVRRLAFNRHLTQRDLAAVERITAGLLKLLHPDGSFTESEMAFLASTAVEFRQRVHNQLMRVAPGEFSEKRIAFQGMLPTPAADLPLVTEEIQRYDRLNHEAVVGEITALAVITAGRVEVGGDLTIIEVSLVPGQTGLEVVGGRGAVLRESVRAAHRLVHARSTDLGIPEDRLAKHKVVVHLVHIADEREGPSAGAAFVAAMVSALKGIPVRPAIAVTGEVSLHGKVTRVGGIAEKIRAAARSGRKVVIFPRENASDIQRVPDAVLEGLDLVPVDHIDEVLEAALEGPP